MREKRVLPPARGQMLLLAVAFEGGLVALWIALGLLLNMKPSTLGRADAPALLLGSLATLPLLPLLLLMSRSSLAPLRRLMGTVDEILVPYLSGLGIADFALIALLAGVGEEGLFRGILQGGLAQAVSPLFGLAAASVLFGVLHWITPTYALVAGFLGCYMGILYHETGNLVVPMVVHTLYDFFALCYLVRWRVWRRETGSVGKK